MKKKQPSRKTLVLVYSICAVLWLGIGFAFLADGRRAWMAILNFALAAYWGGMAFSVGRQQDDGDDPTEQ